MTRHSQGAPLPRCLGVAAGTAGLTAAILAWLRPELRAAAEAVASGRLAAAPFDRCLVWVCALAVAGCALWLCVVTALLARDAAAGQVRSRRGVPVALRRWVFGLCGLALTTGLATPATAGPTASDRPRGPASSVHGLPLPERATTTTHVSHLVLRAVRRHPEAPPRARRTTVVAPGDTLWSLAAAELGGDATDVEIARHWRAIYEANRSTIGADPDLIHPGQRLRLPHP